MKVHVNRKSPQTHDEPTPLTKLPEELQKDAGGAKGQSYSRTVAKVSISRTCMFVALNIPS